MTPEEVRRRAGDFGLPHGRRAVDAPPTPFGRREDDRAPVPLVAAKPGLLANKGLLVLALLLLLVGAGAWLSRDLVLRQLHEKRIANLAEDSSLFLDSMHAKFPLHAAAEEETLASLAALFNKTFPAPEGYTASAAPNDDGVSLLISIKGHGLERTAYWIMPQ